MSGRALAFAPAGKAPAADAPSRAPSPAERAAASPAAGRAAPLPTAFAHDFSGVRLRAPEPLLQPRLVVGEPGDACEREAERVAEAVTASPRAGARVGGRAVEGRVQRCARCGGGTHEAEEDEEHGGAPPEARVSERVDDGRVQPMCAKCAAAAGRSQEGEEEDERLHAAPAAGQVPAVTPAVRAAMDASGAGRPLDAGSQAFFAPRLGADLAGVRVHHDAPAARAAQALGARAFTRGEDIYFAAGEYRPESAPGRRLLAHELAHTLQQRGGAEPHTLRRQPASWHSGGGGAALAEPPARRTAPPPSAAPTTAPPVVAPEPAPATPPPSGAGSAPAAPPSAPPGAPGAGSPTGPTADTASAGAPDAAPGANGAAAPAAEEERPPAPAGSSSELLQSLAGARASDFPAQVSRVRAASATAAAQERKELQASLPEVERPTGLPAVPAPPSPDQRELPEGDAPDVPEGSRQGDAATAPAPTPEPAQPVPGSQPTAAEAIPEPAAEEEGSWFDWLFDAVRRFTGSLPTSDPGVPTSAGPRPRVDRTGDADPALETRQQQASDAEVAARRAEADGATHEDFGEHGIAPTCPPETLRSSHAISGGEGAAPAPGAQASAEDVVRAGVDRSAAGRVRSEVDAGVQRDREGRAEMERRSAEERDDAREQIAAEDARVRREQEHERGQAVSDVDGRRGEWRAANAQAGEAYSGDALKRRADTDTQVAGEITRGEGRADAELTQAEERAAEERRRTEAEAERKRREAEQKPRGFWSRLKGAVSSFFSSLRQLVTGLFNALRRFVRQVFDAAKRLAVGFIDLARRAVVGLIRAFGEALKGLVTIALAAFPDAAEKARNWIDRRVDGAVRAVNRAADALKRFAVAVLDALADALDFVLSVYQKIYETIVDVLNALAMLLLDLMERIAHLVEAARQMPDHFWGQMSEELIGSDVTAPFPFERTSPAPAPALALAGAPAGGAPGPGTADASVLTRPTLTDADVQADQVVGMTLPPELLSRIPLRDGAEVEFGASSDPERSMAAVQQEAAASAAEPGTAPATSTVPESAAPQSASSTGAAPTAAGPEGETAAAPGEEAASVPSDPEAQIQALMNKPVEGGCTKEKQGEPASQGQVPEAQRVYGPFTAMQRTRYLLHQMKEGIKQWFSCNWPWLLAAVIGALAVLVVAEILTGGAITAALPAVMQILTVVMVGVSLVRITAYVGEYLSQGWEGRIADAAKSLARGLAIGAIELIFALLFDLDAVLKAAREGIRATVRGAITATKASLRTLARSGRQLAEAGAHAIRNPLRAAALVGKAVARRGRIIMRGVREGFERGVRSLEEFGARLLERTRFRRFKLVIRGRRIGLYGYINPWVLLADGSIVWVDPHEVPAGARFGDPVSIPAGAGMPERPGVLVPDIPLSAADRAVIAATASSRTLAQGADFADHFARHRGLLEGVLGTHYPVPGGEAAFLRDLEGLMRSGTLRPTGLSTVKAGQPLVNVFEGSFVRTLADGQRRTETLMLVMKPDGEFVTLLNAGRGAEPVSPIVRGIRDHMRMAF